MGQTRPQNSKTSQCGERAQNFSEFWGLVWIMVSPLAALWGQTRPQNSNETSQCGEWAQKRIYNVSKYMVSSKVSKGPLQCIERALTMYRKGPYNVSKGPLQCIERALTMYQKGPYKVSKGPLQCIKRALTMYQTRPWIKRELTMFQNTIKRHRAIQKKLDIAYHFQMTIQMNPRCMPAMHLVTSHTTFNQYPYCISLFITNPFKSPHIRTALYITVHITDTNRMNRWCVPVMHLVTLHTTFNQ